MAPAVYASPFCCPVLLILIGTEYLDDLLRYSILFSLSIFAFAGYPADARLDPTDATFVDVIHTDDKSILKLGFG